MQTITIKKTSDEAKKERKYPYMGIHEDESIIVWFTKPSTGTAIKHPDKDVTTFVYDSWHESLFTPMQGEYTFNFENK